MSLLLGSHPSLDFHFLVRNSGRIGSREYPGHFDPLLRDEHLLRDFDRKRILKRTTILQKRHKLFQTQAKTHNRGRIQPSFKAGDLVFV